MLFISISIQLFGNVIFKHPRFYSSPQLLICQKFSKHLLHNNKRLSLNFSMQKHLKLSFLSFENLLQRISLWKDSFLLKDNSKIMMNIMTGIYLTFCNMLKIMLNTRKQIFYPLFRVIVYDCCILFLMSAIAFGFCCNYCLVDSIFEKRKCLNQVNIALLTWKIDTRDISSKVFSVFRREFDCVLSCILILDISLIR